ncbi:hypothetical protein EDB83DRAFT_2318666 [Lactarius deliciosus]|nr:hypothetical protein EDB83DRAFT_2318666 [Lactarius deliciosus]
MGDPVAEHGRHRWCPPSRVTASVVVVGDIAARGVAIGGACGTGAGVECPVAAHFVVIVVVGGGERKGKEGRVNREQGTQTVNNHWKIDFDKKKEHVFPSSRAPSPPTLPYTLRATPKRPLQESLVEAPRHHRPPPTPRFTDGGVFSSRLEYGSNDITLEAGQDQDLRRSFHLTQLKRSSLHLEKCWVKQKIEEHEIALQVLKERMTDIEESIASTTSKVDRCSICMTPDTAESRRIFQRHYAATTTTHDELFTRRFTFAAAHLPIPPDSDHPEYQV